MPAEILGSPGKWLALSVLAALLLGWTVRSLVRVLRYSVVAALPICPEQPLQLPGAGSYDLYVEGLRFTTDFARIEFALLDPRRVPVRLRPAIFRTLVSGARRIRLRLRSFEATAAGRYTLQLSGIQPDQDPENRIVVARSITQQMVLHILAIVVLGSLAMGALGIAAVVALV